MSDDPKNIYEAMAAIMADLDAIEKNSTNKQQGFKYRGIDAVYNSLHPIFSKHGVVMMPDVLDKTREERQTKSGGFLIYTILRMKYTFYHKSGTSISCVVEGEGMDSGDKSSNKAMSVAQKYALFQVFLIPTEEIVDLDADSYELSENEKKSATIPLIFGKDVMYCESAQDWAEKFLKQVAIPNIDEDSVKSFVSDNLDVGRKIYAVLTKEADKKAENLKEIFKKYK